MKMIEKGNFDTQVDVNSSNEIGQLGLRFNRMTAKIKELMLQNVQEQELKRKSELKALQAQINPHFLYNTLDSIIWMAEVNKSKEVVLMVSSLAKLFRLSLSKGDEIIPIRNEIEHIKSYLTIQKMRYKDKLDFEIQVDDHILSYKTIKIILQPLVENSIYHGIKNKDGVGLIRITGTQVGNKIVLSVIDNGIGMTPETLEALLQKPVPSEQGSGMGVNNVNQRIKLYYGEEYGLQYESEPGQGTTVHIWLPMREQP
jgi:two-component system sensor histidine kinase YesM